MKQNIDICGIAETHWKEKGHFKTEHHTVYMSGNEENSRNGTAFIVSNKTAKHVRSYETISDRIVKISFHAKPVNFHILQVYMPTSAADDEVIEEVYSQIEEVLRKTPAKEPVLVIGDFNAKVGQAYDPQLKDVVGPYSIGERNERGERFIQFAIENKLSVMNTMFQHHARRLSTWISPCQVYRNQIDYVLVRKRWRTSVKNVKVKPGADCDTDHKLLVCSFALKMHVVKKKAEQESFVVEDKNLFKQKLEAGKPADLDGIEDPEAFWSKCKEWILTAMKESRPTQRIQKKHWMTDATLKLVEERRQLRRERHKADVGEKIKKLNKEIKKACAADKNRHLLNICADLERYSNRNESKEMYRTVKYLSRELKPETQIIKNEDGLVVTEPEEIAEVWRQYCIKLYLNKNPGTSSTHQRRQCEVEPEILRSEVAQAVKKIRNGKSPGVDGIVAENIKAMDDLATDHLHKLCNLIWKTGKWPDDWVHSIFIPIFKKGSPTLCSNYRTVSLVSHASKVLLHIIHNRLKSFLMPEIAEEQCGFVPGKGTREQILNVRQIIEKAREFNLKAYLCFVDYTKAFDSVNWEALWKILDRMGVPEHLSMAIRNLYQHNTATVKVNKTTSKTFKTQAGTRQGCILSPLLFNIYTEYIMRKVLEGWEGGITIGGRKISNLRYADDTLILAATEEELRAIMEKLERVSRAYGLEINAAKTKVMIIDRQNENQPSVTRIAGYDVVQKFNYLGSVVSNTGGSSDEVKRRLAMARTQTVKLSKIWKDRTISKATKIRLVETLIFPIATYAAETWTLKQVDRRKVESFEMWVYRRLLRISWTEHRTNISVLLELNIKTRLLDRISQSYLRYFGHIVRRQDGMEKLVVEGKVSGRRSRGRSPMRWTDQLTTIIGKSPAEATRLAQDRESWRRQVVMVTTP